MHIGRGKGSIYAGHEQGCQGLLADNGIIHSTHLLVPWILNKDKSDLCPLKNNDGNG